ncbi:septum formation family protein [Lentzea flaviverrucosa]|uniref:Septum formation n=1 Tax=Lentzea flaviverrucosa TaxID=200379 RepID=A0A1H9Q415_9PSEU|nr:septum formation family protein [Lentzea flaviverrucosa]RDI29631.1 putative regulator of septum formation [Lentzea flaviverrucosa]SER55316.1 Septum formation [Lentzea flaviverrucosa]
MTRVRLAVAIVLSALTLSACAIQVGGQAVPGPLPSTASASAPALPKAGQCMNAYELKVLQCTDSHEAEVMSVGELTGLPTTYPDTQALRKAALPPCRQTLTEYLGSGDADSTRLRVWAFWPNEQGWKDGQRWRLCTVVEISPDEKPLARKGSVKDVLKSNGFGTFQTCTQGSPSKDQEVKVVACATAHMAEAVPGGVVSLGKSTDPAPSKEQMNSIANEKCTKAVHDYLGSTKRSDVFPAWRNPGSQAWSEGWTNAVCYAEATRTFGGTLLGIRDNPLPN